MKIETKKQREKRDQVESNLIEALNSMPQDPEYGLVRIINAPVKTVWICCDDIPPTESRKVGKVPHGYCFEFSRIDNSQKLLGWLLHLFEKGWFSRHHASALIKVCFSHGVKINMHS